MTKDELLKLILQSDELPTLPTVASELITLTAREDATIADIAALVSKDVSLSAKILKVSNSSFYSFPQTISSINQAVGILGMNAVRSLVLSFSFLNIGTKKSESKFNFNTFWQRSLATAVAAKLIVDMVEDSDTEQIFVCGLLQNLGKLIFAKTVPEKYDTVLLKAEQSKEDILFIEEQILGLNHAHVGAAVARNWGFPEVLVLPIEHHHDPGSYTGKDHTIKTTINAVYLAKILISVLFNEEPQIRLKEFRQEARTLLQLNNEQIEDILGQVHLLVKEAGEYFNLKIQQPPSVQEILQEANIRLSLINLDYDQMNKQLVLAKIHLENLTQELEEKNRILDNLANIDGLTGAYNHRYFQNTLDQEISRAIRNESQISLLLVDIDHFKQFNDRHGHQTGDFILKEFSKSLEDNIRNHDTLARYGGEEFVLILPETGTEDALVVGEKLRSLIDAMDFESNGEKYHVTASFGHASCTPAIDDDFNKDQFINQADTALYEAKTKGRNRVETFTPKKKWFSLKG